MSEKKKKICVVWKTRTLFREKILLNLALGTMRNRFDWQLHSGVRPRGRWQEIQIDQALYIVEQPDRQLERISDNLCTYQLCTLGG